MADTTRKIHALIFTGGHGFQQEPFWEMFNSFDNVSYDAVTFPDAFKHLNVEGAKGYNVLVFYDMWQEITPEQQREYLNLLRHGKPIVYLHHAMASFRNWEEYRRILGGYWKPGEGTYKHGVKYTVQIADSNHPVTKGMQDFEIEDETYGNFHVNPDAHALLRANHPDSGPIVGWTHRYGASPIVYIQLGHDGLAYSDPNFRRLVSQAMRWVIDQADSRG
jgi:hypothetical protein